MPRPDWRALLSLRGRLGRGAFWWQSLLLALGFALAFLALEATLGRTATWLVYPPAFWLALRLGVRRYHDLGRSGAWLLCLLVPLLGPLWVAVELLLRGGRRETNRFGAPIEGRRHDYHRVP
ncbi:MAG TPA: DUF805 domain-containing protein [Arenimonas sp.]|uniref:DUF805 domain-containing protein n=1 Tax=Arenimonas sp. TaxID=1872635 RepID=UPI002D7E5C44|nr:DUF805 domain-containing protein [Arenimonas sp.]HEU0153823.1 DUF805 domain-containing protein [Arenimonas sp.]